MPWVTVTHLTRYRYSSSIALGPHRLMLRPRETRDLRIAAFGLKISPEACIEWSNDVAGNAIATARFNAMTEELTIRACTRIELRASDWPIFPITAAASTYPFSYTQDDWIDLGALATPQYADETGRLSQWAEAFVLARPTDTLSLLKDISSGIANQISYQTREAEGTQGPLETIDRGWGTCRDLSVLFAEAARTLGFGARLVSGYLYEPSGTSFPSPNAGSTHAWAEVFIPGAGWISFDPTNRSVGSRNLIPVAVARTIQQVSPVIGSFHGRASELIAMDVAVDVEGAADSVRNFVP